MLCCMLEVKDIILTMKNTIWGRSESKIINYILQILGYRIGEGNGTPLQYSCLENPMDGGAWWATVHGVTQSQTRLSD